ncbi:MAG: TRAFs-binding domain-containing protein [Candidatus Adiutricales bacterium]
MEEKSQILDIDSIVLPPEIRELVKRLAEYNHGRWKMRMTDQGWQNGAKYEKESQTRPGLVSWKKLPQSMQAQFLNQAQETIKVAIAWGYKIKGPVNSSNAVKDIISEKNRNSAKDFISEKNRNTAIVKFGRGDTNIDLKSSLALWRTRKFGKWSKSPKIYKQLARQFLKLDESKNAYEVAMEGLSFIPRDVSLRQIMALALIRTGDASRAIELAQKLYDEGHRDEETFGLLGQANKDLAEKAIKEDDKKYYQLCSFDIYNQAFEETGGYYSGINAATLAVLLGEKKTARDIADRVRKKCLVELDSRRANSDELYWLLATLAEISLIANQLDEAEQWYKDAVKIASNRWGAQATTRRNTRVLMSALNYDSRLLKRLENCFLIPRIAIFFGRSLDQARELLLVDDLELNREIKNSIAVRLRRSDARIGYTAVVSGVDILFLETVLEIGGEINAVLPFNNGMDIFEDEWKERLNRVLNRANNVSNFQEHVPAKGYEERRILNEKITEMGRVRSAQLDTEIMPLAIIDLEKEEGQELLSERIKKLREIGSNVQLIDPGENYRQLTSSRKKQSENTTSSPDNSVIKETLK